MERRKFGFSPRRKDAIMFASHWRLLGVTWTEISDRFHPSPQRVTRMEIELVGIAAEASGELDGNGVWVLFF